MVFHRFAGRCLPVPLSAFRRDPSPTSQQRLSQIGTKRRHRNSGSDGGPSLRLISPIARAASALAQFFVLMAAMVLCACATVPMTAAMTLTALDPMTIDPRVLRVAAKLPDWVRIESDSARLVASVHLAGAAGPEVRSFPLIEVTDDRLKGIAEEGGEFTITAFALPPDQVAGMIAWRDDLASRAPKSGNRFTLSVSADACLIETNRDVPVPFSTYLASDPTREYVVLSREVDLRKVARRYDAEASLKPCS